MAAKQAKKSLGPRVRTSVFNFLKNAFVNPNAGAEFALEAFRVLVLKSQAELYGVFTHEELHLILTALEDLELYGDQFGEHLRTDVIDAIRFGSLRPDTGHNVRVLQGKFQGLSRLQLGALGIWAKAYWTQKDKQNDQPEGGPTFLEQYLSQLAYRQGQLEPIETSV